MLSNKLLDIQTSTTEQSNRRRYDLHSYHQPEASKLYSPPSPVRKLKYETQLANQWQRQSSCHFGCMEHSKGIQIVRSQTDGSKNIQLCDPEVIVSSVQKKVA